MEQKQCSCCENEKHRPTADCQLYIQDQIKSKISRGIFTTIMLIILSAFGSGLGIMWNMNNEVNAKMAVFEDKFGSKLDDVYINLIKLNTKEESRKEFESDVKQMLKKGENK